MDSRQKVIVHREDRVPPLTANPACDDYNADLPGPPALRWNFDRVGNMRSKGVTPPPRARDRWAS